MTKRVLDNKILKRVIRTTQRIEGYDEASKKVREDAKKIREKHGIKVSAKK